MDRIILLFVAFIITASSIALANDDPDFSERIRASGIVNETESILLSSNVYFYPNKKGFGLLSGGNERTKAYIVFTENGFAVVDWSRKRKAYEVVHQEDYAEIESANVSGNSPFLRLVTESKASGKFNSFEIIDGKNAITPSVIKTKEAHKLISAGIKGYDVKEVASASDLSTAEIADQKRRMQELEERIARLEQGQGNDETGNGENVGDSECDCKCPQN